MAAACPQLARAVAALEAVAPVGLAAKWDNVGLLVDASKPWAPAATAAAAAAAAEYHVFFTNDLTTRVLEEAVAARAALIVTYHPTPFSAMKTFRMSHAGAAVVLTCAREGMAVYSPHTALDVVPGGINDWLVDGVASALGGEAGAAAAGGTLFRHIRRCCRRRRGLGSWRGVHCW